MLRYLPNTLIFASLFSLSLSPASVSLAQDHADSATAIGNLNEAYVVAFNQQDSAKLAQCLAENGDFTLLTGETVQGRENVAHAHKAFFEYNPEAKIEGKQLSLREVADGVFVASGKWKVTNGPSQYPSSGLWFTVVVHRDGKWQYEAMRLMAPAKAK